MLAQSVVVSIRQNTGNLWGNGLETELVSKAILLSLHWVLRVLVAEFLVDDKLNLATNSRISNLRQVRR